MMKQRLVLGVVVLVVLGGGLGWYLYQNNKSSTPSYETATVVKGSLISSISASGTISSGNNTSITTGASGTVKQVFVTNGSTVKKGDKIAELILDEYGVEQQATAYSNYIDATTAVKVAQKSKTDADIQMWKDRQAILDAKDAVQKKLESGINPKTNKEYTENERAIIDKTLPQMEEAFTVSELQYKTAGAEISKASAKVTSARREYQDYAATITAPADGIVGGLTLAPGTVIEQVTSTGNSNSMVVTTQSIGEINNPRGQLQASVSLTQMDVIHVKADQKVTMTLDAYSDKTFTGKVLSVNTKGSVSSNVASYPVTILLDHTEVSIYPNMAVTAQIITNLTNDVLTVPTTAITTANGVSTVQVMQNGKPVATTITIGSANDTDTEIITGLKEGDVVVTATILPTTATSTNTTSVFGSTNRSSNRNSSGLGGGMSGGPPGGF